MPISNDEMVEAILRPIDQACESHGLTPFYLARVLKKLTKSKDEKIQLGAVKEGFQLRGCYPPKNHKISGIPEHITITFTEDFGTKK